MFTGVAKLPSMYKIKFGHNWVSLWFWWRFSDKYWAERVQRRAEMWVQLDARSKRRHSVPPQGCKTAVYQEKSTILFKPWRAKSLITLDAFTETANTVAVTVTHAHTKVMRKEFISHVTQNITSTYLPNRVIASPMLLSCDYVINILSN